MSRMETIERITRKMERLDEDQLAGLEAWMHALAGPSVYSTLPVAERLAIDDAQGTDGRAAAYPDRSTRIKADVGLSRDQRVFPKLRIGECILDNQDLVALDCDVAKSIGACRAPLF